MTEVEDKKGFGNTGDLVCETLRAKIIELDIQPGLMISINDLMQEFNIGRSPVRDALIRLEQEGLVIFLPQRGTMISKIDLDRVEAERFLRFSVEENVMQEFLASFSNTDILELEEMIRQQRDAAQTGDSRIFMRLDDEFHFYFYNTTNRKFCADTLWNASGHYRRIRLLTSEDGGLLQNVIREHEEMLAALCARDMNALQNVFSRHLSKISTQVHALLKKYPDLFVQTVVEEKPKNIWNTDFLKTLKAERRQAHAFEERADKRQSGLGKGRDKPAGI